MEFEEKVLKLLGELNTRQIKFERDLTSIKESTALAHKDLASVKERTGLTHQEVISLYEDMTMMKDDSNKTKEEQKYQLNKWADLDRRVDKLERKVLS